MSSDYVIRVDHLYKKFTKDLRRSMVYGVKDIAKDWLGIPTDRSVLRPSEAWALQDINFELKRGETIGIIGRNGAGKSTLLRLLNGIYPPDKGRIEVRGKIAAMIALGAGFHPHLTGRENIFLSGSVLGMSKHEVASKLDSIIDFADLEDFIDSPVASYSSGMYVRLGFSIATHAPIEILLADEVLAVGDLAFKVKSFNRIGELRKEGVSTLLVSHDMTQISMFCNQVLLMDRGKSQYLGEVEKGVELYLRDFLHSLDSLGVIEKPVTGNDDFIVHEVRFGPEFVDNQVHMQTGQSLEILIDYSAVHDLHDVVVNIMFELPIPTSSPFFQATNNSFKHKINLKRGRGTLKCSIRNINLNNFKLFMNFSVWLDNQKSVALWWKRVPVHVVGESLSSGFAFFDVDYSAE
jgi:ABC-type polysaccharide/polyol phosphate transport system ATPase subunit